MSKVVSFPFTFIGKTKLGKIYRPYAIVYLFSKARNKWQPVEMIVDTGADYSLLPKQYATVLGINLVNECLMETTVGVGGAENVYQYKNLPIRIGNWQKQIPVGFLQRDDTPALLGRLGCLEIFHLTLVKNKQSIFELL